MCWVFLPSAHSANNESSDAFLRSTREILGQQNFLFSSSTSSLKVCIPCALRSTLRQAGTTAAAAQHALSPTHSPSQPFARLFCPPAGLQAVEGSFEEYFTPAAIEAVNATLELQAM